MAKIKSQDKKIHKTEQQWREDLNDAQYHVLRQKGTEAPFTGEYDHFDKTGQFHCAACGNPLFSSDTKYDSGSGWPSFYQPLTEANIIEQEEYEPVRQVEVICSQCQSHLGHVYPDGPKPTGLRYCINSVALKFTEKK